jgi:hypothetical protein
VGVYQQHKTSTKEENKSSSNFLELNHEEKLTKILNPSTPDQIRTVTSFIRQSLELREGDSSQS